MHELVLDRIEVPEPVEVVHVDVREDHGVQHQCSRRAVALVRLDHQRPVGTLLRAGAEPQHLGPDHEGRVAPGAAQHHGEEGGGGGLAVGAGDTDGPVRGGDRGEGGRTVDHRDARLPCGDELDVAGGNGRGVHDPVGA